MKMHIEVKMHNLDLGQRSRFLWIGRQAEAIYGRGEIPTNEDWARWQKALGLSLPMTEEAVSTLRAAITVRRAVFKGKQAATALSRPKPKKRPAPTKRCEDCEGDGAFFVEDPSKHNGVSTTTCPTCEGSGRVPVHHQFKD